MKKSMKMTNRIAFNKIGFVACVVLLSVVLGTSLSWARTIIVPDHYSTIQAAITAATVGDTILVRAGAYSGSITMKAGVNLIGEGKETTTWTVSGTITGASNTKLEGFKIINGNYTCSSCSNVKIQNNAFVIATNANYTAVSLTNVTSAEIVNNSVKVKSTKAASSTLKGINISGSSVLIANNTLSLESLDVVQGLAYTGTTHSVKNNIIKTSSTGDPDGGAPVKAQAIYTGGTDTLELKYNLLVGKIDETKVGFKVGNIIGADPCFVVDDDFLTLQVKSPAIDAGDPTYYLYAMGVKNIGVYNAAGIVRNIKEIQNLINAALPGETVYIPVGIYSFSLLKWNEILLSSSSPVSTVYSRSLVINKNITLKALSLDPDKTVIDLSREITGSGTYTPGGIYDEQGNLYLEQCIAVMDPYYYGGSCIYSANGFNTVNDVTIEGITIKVKDGLFNASETVTVWVQDKPVYTGYGYQQTGHWASFTQGKWLSPIYNYSKKLTIKNCKIPTKNSDGYSIYTWLNTQVVLQGTNSILGNTLTETRRLSGGPSSKPKVYF